MVCNTTLAEEVGQNHRIDSARDRHEEGFSRGEKLLLADQVAYAGEEVWHTAQSTTCSGWVASPGCANQWDRVQGRAAGSA